MRDYTSASQIGMYVRCGEQYRRRYVEGEVIPPGIAATKGRAVHKGAEVNMSQKVKSRVDLPEADVVDAAVAEFTSSVESDGLSLTDEEKSVGQTGVVSDGVDAVVDLARCHIRDQAPDYQPIEVEGKFEIELPGRNLLGYIDLIDDRMRVVDFKTSGKKKSQIEADTSVQLTIYAAGAALLTGGEIPKELRLDVMVQKRSGEVVRQVVETSRDVGDLQVLANRINSVEAAIQSGTYIPADPGSWWCSAKWCGYHSTCRYAVQGREAKNVK